VSGLINQFDYEHLGCSPARFRAFGAALHTHATHNCLIYYYLYLVFGVSESLGDLSLNGFQNTNFLIFICVLLAWLDDKQFPCPCPLSPLFFLFDNLNNFAMWKSAVGCQYFNGLSRGDRWKCSLVISVCLRSQSAYLLLSMKYE